MKRTSTSICLAVGSLALIAGPHAVQAQQAPVPPASGTAAPAAPGASGQATPPVQVQPVPAAPAGQSQLPPVDVIQKKAPAPKQQAAPQPKIQPKAAQPAEQAAPVPKAKVTKQAAPAPKQKQAAPAPQPDVQPEPVVVEALPADPNPIYGAQNSTGAAARATQAAQTPINPTSIVPKNLDGFATAASNISSEKLAEEQPRNVNEAFKTVPGVIVINDDASGHHGGIAVRGSPGRRSRKILTMEDGHPVNLALWTDPSVHYWAPVDRLESVEVLKGTIITHGPLNNFGVINARNLSPFGAPETVVSAAIGFTRTRNGFFDDDGDIISKKSETDISARWHIHTRQQSGNVGLVLSYTGEDVQGAWDTERLRFHDFYGAVGWKGVDQDLTVSVVYARQKDNYDEANLVGEDGDPAGAVEAAFFDAKHCKTCFAPGAFLNNYTGDIWRSQITHNMFVDPNTTVTTRVYAQRHRRDRYQTLGNESNPADPEIAGIIPNFSPSYVDDGLTLSDAFAGEDSMFGRLRTFRHIGAEARAEFANRPFLAGLSQDIQVGLRYEYQDMTNRNFLGLSGEALSNGDKDGLTIFDRSLQASTVSAFLQTSIKASNDLRIVPGVRLEWYKVKRQSRVTAAEEGEAEELEEGTLTDESGVTCSDVVNGGPDECVVIEGINRTPFNDSTSSFRLLPGIAFAYNGFYKTTIFGGYNRGISTLVLRNEDFPTEDEIGDNFQLGFRTTAIRGVQFELAGFHQRLHDFQYGASFSTAGDRSFGTADEVRINGVELAGRINSQPWVGGPVNVFAQGQYTYANAKIKKGTTFDEDDNPIDLAGKDLPEVPFHIAALTLGVENKTGWGWKWDASMTWTYRGAFFTDEVNTAFGGDPEGENGEVPSVWLVSARANLQLGNSGASVFIAGDNLTDKLYITDREDGIKPGLGRTIWTGFKYKF